MTNRRIDGDGDGKDGHAQFPPIAADGHAHLSPIAAGGHGRAALLLVESLIHGLVERSVLTVPEAIEIIEIAAEIEIEGLRSDADGNGSQAPVRSLLAPLAASLSFELKR